MSKLAIVQPSFITNAKKGLILTGNAISKQSPIILAGTAMIGVAATGYLAYKAGLQVEEVIRHAEEEKGDTLTKQEAAQATWRLWIPPVASGVLTIGAIVASTAISEKRRAALAGLYAMSEASLKEYQEKTKEVVGPKKEQEIRDGVNADHVKDPPPWDVELPAGKVWIKDKLTNRYFFDDVQSVRAAANHINESIFSGEMCMSLNDFYDILDNPQLPPCELGSYVGWSISHTCELYFTSALTSDMRPVLVLDWAANGDPRTDYREI